MSTKARVHLSELNRSLHLFAQAIAGLAIALHPSRASATDAWHDSTLAADSAAVHVPAEIDAFDDVRDNRLTYRVTVLHQLCLDAFGTFDFRLATAREQIRSLPDQAAGNAMAHYKPARHDLATAFPRSQAQVIR